jgi:hypothetical protein
VSRIIQRDRVLGRHHPRRVHWLVLDGHVICPAVLYLVPASNGS